MMRGKLLKRSNYLHTWKTRIFELDTGLLVRTLRYYDSNGKMKGELVLNGQRCVIQLLDEATSGKPHCFALSAGGRTLIMSAGSDSAMRKWIDFLEKNGATLLGAEQVEQQELWRSVMEAEERMKNREMEMQFTEPSSSSGTVESARSSFGGFSESSTGHTEEEEFDRLDDPIEADIGQPSFDSNPESTRSSSLRQSQDAGPIDALAAKVEARMINMGMFRESLPSAHAPSKCNIFLSEDWQTCDKLIVFLGNSLGGGGGRGVPPGIWSRSGCSVLGLENGSMLGYLERSQIGGYGSIVLDTCTHTNLVEINGNLEKMPVPGSETAERHIATVWERFISHAQAESVFVIAYGLGGECFKEFLESNTQLLFSNKAPCLKAIALLDSSHTNKGITQEAVRRFLRQRAINWQESPEAIGAIVPEQEGTVGCLCMSAGRNSVDANSSNRAWIIPVVKDVVFRFLDFCIDVDAEVGDTGVYFSDRWAAMESQSKW